MTTRARTIVAATALALGGLAAFGTTVTSTQAGGDSGWNFVQPAPSGTPLADSGWNGPDPEPTETPAPPAAKDSGWN